MNSFEKVHIIKVKGFIDKSLRKAQSSCIIHFLTRDLSMHFQGLDPHFLCLNLFQDRVMVVNKKVKKRSHQDIVGCRRESIVVYRQVDKQGESREMYDWAELIRSVLVELEHIDEDEFQKTDQSPEHEEFYDVFDLGWFVLWQVDQTGQERDIGANAT